MATDDTPAGHRLLSLTAHQSTLFRNAIHPDVPAPLTPAQVRAGVHLHLARLTSRTAERFTYARAIGGGFHELLAHQDGNHIRWISDPDLTGLDIAEMHELGRRRLREVVIDECQRVTGKGAAVFCVRGESSFIASKLLVLPDLVRSFAARRLHRSDGALVAVPSRHRLAFAPVDEAVADNVAAIATLAAYDYAHDRSPISPLVFWWRDGRLYPLFGPGAADVHLCNDIPEEFWEAWGRNDRQCADEVDPGSDAGRSVA